MGMDRGGTWDNVGNIQGPAEADGADGQDGVSPARVVWIADDGTGDYELLSAALASITDASATKPYVIKIAPGTYTETATVILKDHVDVEGSGQGITTIECACNNASRGPSAAVVSAAGITAEIRHLTINSTGGSGNDGIGVYTTNRVDGLDLDESFSMLHVTATATATSGSYAYGVYNYVESDPTMNNVTATAIGNNFSYGVENDDNSETTIQNSTITGSTYSIKNWGSNNFAKVADTTLDGPVSIGGGLTCVTVRDADFDELGPDCQ